MLRFRRFRVILRHDTGTVALTVVAVNRAAAVRQVLAAEGAPSGAVVSVARVA